MTQIQVLLFDVGGILIELGGIDHWKKLSSQTDSAEMWRRWLECQVVKDFESGRSTPDTFARDMVDKYELSVSSDHFIDKFAQWPIGFYDGAEALVADVRPDIKAGCFSNTNDIHWAMPCNQGVHTLFDLHFLSFKMGHVKPDESAFQYVVDALACEPEAIFFVDDNIINVDAARACGFDAHVAKGPVETRQVLNAHGLLK
ncbi:MAG: HAD-IA family hydrolase [Rhodospirillales bacterium]|jgi:glucose-1-phosphatase|nr:HAD-IA family hydrolase [Rhodospirillales bacterium]MBT4041415.1 HAD-IA family hydrolase [Rhodospirillales bacterium]MBT4628288.1 HAD-IA family hydrolase [Rhodospirillales bacterium]MBT5352302.1 HAD-IA family hydrolase [Rhodospirillales bacterium]MBT5521049.1 HAD-IA family hydrolase [Rhodospirillales bacterium]